MSTYIKRPLAKGYSEAGASLEKRALKGMHPSSGSPAEDINQSNSILRQRARMLYMASPIAASAINTNRTKAVGTGLTVKSTIDRETLGLTADDAKNWQRHTETEWKLWAEHRENCDALGLNNFYGLQQLAFKSALLSGDTFALIKRYALSPTSPYSLRLHIVEADRICNPFSQGTFSLYITNEMTIPDGQPGAGHKVYDGVEVDTNGKVVAYHICSTYPQSSIPTDKTIQWTRVEAFGKKSGMPNILHIMSAERPDQYRGVPYLAQVIEPLLQLRRYTESELMSALIQSYFTAWIITKTDPSEIPLNEVGVGGIAGEVPEENPNEVSRSESEYEMGSGTIAHLAEGEDVKFGSPQIPTAGFETFTKTICKTIGAGLELPYDVLIKEFNSSYSASRGALLEAWEAIKMRRAWFVEDFCQPVYELWLSEAIARGRIKAPGFFDDPAIRAAWCNAQWIGPVAGSLDPRKEAEAAITLIDRGIKTHDQVTREQSGGDWEANIEQLRHEIELLPDYQLMQFTPEENEKDADGN